MKSIFCISPELKESCVLTEKRDIENADVALLNLDNAQAMIQWEQLQDTNRMLTPITFSAEGRRMAHATSLELPIRLNRLKQALLDLAGSRSIFRINPGTANAASEVKILIVDHEFPVRRYIARKLTEFVKLPLYISFAASGEEAMQRMENNAYDLVFIDAAFRDDAGTRFCKLIKSISDAYVVRLTDRKSRIQNLQGLVSGSNACLDKQSAGKRLAAEVDKCVKHRSRIFNQKFSGQALTEFQM